MPKLRFHSSLATCLLVVALVLISTTTLLAQPAAQKPAMTMTWVLTQGTVVGPVTTSNTADGPLTTYVVEAMAQSQGAKKAVSGKFTVNCSVLEKNGTYYLRGTWDITKPGAAKTVHNTPSSLKGALMAELSSNPATAAGPIDAKVLISPKRRHAGHTPKAAGTFSGNEKFEGTLTVSR